MCSRDSPFQPARSNDSNRAIVVRAHFPRRKPARANTMRRSDARSWRRLGKADPSTCDGRERAFLWYRSCERCRPRVIPTYRRRGLPAVPSRCDITGVERHHVIADGMPSRFSLHRSVNETARPLSSQSKFLRCATLQHNAQALTASRAWHQAFQVCLAVRKRFGGRDS